MQTKPSSPIALARLISAATLFVAGTAQCASIEQVSTNWVLQPQSISDQGEIAGYFSNRSHSLPERPARWSHSGGFQILSEEPYQAYGISGDGRVVVGTGLDSARVWREGSGGSVLPDQGTFHPKDANAANYDGSVIVG